MHFTLCCLNIWKPSFNKYHNLSIIDLVFSTTSEEARHVGVVCKKLHVSQPEAQQLYIINKTDKTLITCLLIFLFSIGNCHFKDIWHFFDWINFIGIAWFLSSSFLSKTLSITVIHVYTRTSHTEKCSRCEIVGLDDKRETTGK
jgi:hypothetical protein